MTDAISQPTDPFTKMLIALWEKVVQAHDPLATQVRPGNRIKRFVDPRANKVRGQDGDFPELDIVPGGWEEIELYGSSDSVFINQTYEFLFTSGSKDESASLFPFKWELLRAIFIHAVEIEPGENGLLDLPFLNKVDIVSQDETRDSEQLNRKTTQWSTSQSIVAFMAFDRKNLRAAEPYL